MLLAALIVAAGGIVAAVLATVLVPLQPPVVPPPAPTPTAVVAPIQAPATSPTGQKGKPEPKQGEPFELTLPGGVKLTMQPIPAGTFGMGEKTKQNVTISRPFWMGKTEVTQAQWEAVMGSNLSDFKGANRPVERVTWDDAMEFCKKVTEQEKSAGRLPADFVYTLPTEAQWEYACRAGSDGVYGNVDNGGFTSEGTLGAMGWHDGNSGEKTHDVGQKVPNAWGLYDMHGNVWEWCLDRYGSFPAVFQISGGSPRVLRGGGWCNGARLCRAASRCWSELGTRHEGVGFRLALSSK